ncbi:MAG: hypothetical protein H7336_12015, partial [Bacteriovorax sp.]|nr:hypothetical protein [Bacteriovorax sp.]
MKFIALIFLILFSSSCSMYGDAFKKAAVHEKMATQLDQTPYEMNLNDLQAKIINYMGSMNLNGKWVYIANPGGNQPQTMAAVNEAMEEGFSYKQNFYSSTWSPDASLFSGDMEKIK